MSKKNQLNLSSCPCGSTKKPENCCLAIINGHEKANTPVQLMRSRYTAYTLGEDSYLLQSWHSSTRPLSIDLDKGVIWSGLKLVSVSKVANEASKKTGYVEFVAAFMSGGVMGQLHERSRFILEHGCWFYADGEQIEPGMKSSRKQPGRNGPCSCGSGKKFKKCCG